MGNQEEKKPRWIPRRPYEEAATELCSLLEGVESDFIRRVASLFIHQGYKFMVKVFYGCEAEITGEFHPNAPRFEVTKLMESLLIATRERDYNLLAVIEHEINLPSECLVTPVKGNIYTA